LLFLSTDLCGLVGENMTQIRSAATARRGGADTTGRDYSRLWFILLATCLVGSVLLIAAGLMFHDARHDASLPSTMSDVDEHVTSVNKSDRLPLPIQIPIATAQPDLLQTVAAPPEQLPLATEDDIRQAEAERHRHRDICPRGRIYFTIERHQYWRCVR
jgi:hypothetical protein